MNQPSSPKTASINLTGVNNVSSKNGTNVSALLEELKAQNRQVTQNASNFENAIETSRKTIAQEQRAIKSLPSQTNANTIKKRQKGVSSLSEQQIKLGYMRNEARRDHNRLTELITKLQSQPDEQTIKLANKYVSILKDPTLSYLKKKDAIQKLYTRVRLTTRGGTSRKAKRASHSTRKNRRHT